MAYNNLPKIRLECENLSIFFFLQNLKKRKAMDYIEGQPVKKHRHTSSIESSEQSQSEIEQSQSEIEQSQSEIVSPASTSQLDLEPTTERPLFSSNASKKDYSDSLLITDSPYYAASPYLSENSYPDGDHCSVMREKLEETGTDLCTDYVYFESFADYQRNYANHPEYNDQSNYCLPDSQFSSFEQISDEDLFSNMTAKNMITVNMNVVQPEKRIEFEEPELDNNIRTVVDSICKNLDNEIVTDCNQLEVIQKQDLDQTIYDNAVTALLGDNFLNEKVPDEGQKVIQTAYAQTPDKIIQSEMTSEPALERLTEVNSEKVVVVQKINEEKFPIIPESVLDSFLGEHKYEQKPSVSHKIDERSPLKRTFRRVMHPIEKEVPKTVTTPEKHLDEELIAPTMTDFVKEKTLLKQEVFESLQNQVLNDVSPSSNKDYKPMQSQEKGDPHVFVTETAQETSHKDTVFKDRKESKRTHSLSPCRPLLAVQEKGEDLCKKSIAPEVNEAFSKKLVQPFDEGNLFPKKKVENKDIPKKQEIPKKCKEVLLSCKTSEIIGSVSLTRTVTLRDCRLPPAQKTDEKNVRDEGKNKLSSSHSGKNISVSPYGIPRLFSSQKDETKDVIKKQIVPDKTRRQIFIGKTLPGYGKKVLFAAHKESVKIPSQKSGEILTNKSSSRAEELFDLVKNSSIDNLPEPTRLPEPDNTQHSKTQQPYTTYVHRRAFKNAAVKIHEGSQSQSRKRKAPEDIPKSIPSGVKKVQITLDPQKKPTYKLQKVEFEPPTRSPASIRSVGSPHSISSPCSVGSPHTLNKENKFISTDKKPEKYDSCLLNVPVFRPVTRSGSNHTPYGTPNPNDSVRQKVSSQRSTHEGMETPVTRKRGHVYCRGSETSIPCDKTPILDETVIAHKEDRIHITKVTEQTPSVPDKDPKTEASSSEESSSTKDYDGGWLTNPLIMDGLERVYRTKKVL